MRTFRTIWKWLVPGWLQKGQGEIVQYTQGVLNDAFAERCRQTTWLGLPSLTPADSLPMVGRDRGLPRGLFEPVATYRARLAGWRFPRGHRVRGTALALLEQVNVALRGTEWVSIDQRGTRYDFGGGATRGVTWNWDGATLLPNWARFWLVVKSTGAPWPSFADGAWGPTVGGDPDIALAGSGIHPGELEAVRRLVRTPLSWSPAGRHPVYLTIYFDGDPFPVPDGAWDVWENRNPLYRYVPLSESEN